MAFTLYQIKPRFQSLLRPLVGRMAACGITANMVTMSACGMSVLLGLLLCLRQVPAVWFALIPLWMLVRMALNAIDGMLAREHGQQSTLGFYLNELTDVIADAALYLPFATVTPLDGRHVAVVIWLSAVAEMTGMLGMASGGLRCYDGPMGKSDRALCFGLLGLLVAVIAPHRTMPPAWHFLSYAMPAMAALLIISIIQRTKAGIHHAQSGHC